MLTDWRDRLEEARDERELTDLEREMLKAIRKLQKQTPAKRKRLVSDDDDLTALLCDNVTTSSLGLSPIFDFEVDFHGIVYPTPMNAFQAQKAKNSSSRIKYTLCSVAEASKYGRAEEIDISKWDAEKYELMQDILRETLLQHPETAKCLVEASMDNLVEDTLKDPYWPHHLPQIWRTLRDELREADKAVKDED